MKIFILEDLPERQEAFRKKFVGHEVKIVDTVVDAIALLKAESFDLVCLDHDLGGQNGVDFKDPNCGSRVAEALRDMNYAGQIIIHSLNPVGAANMKAILPQAIMKPSYFQEPFMIDNFSGKKLTEYLKDGKRVLMLYHCGWGDLLTFMVAYNKLVELYPKVEFTLYLENDQDKIFPSVNKIEEEKYDLVFSPNFPMGEGSGLTKIENCCIKELGIPPINGIIELPKKRSPIVLTHHQGTALPDSVNCVPEVAMKIWEEIKKTGFVPMESHFVHGFHNPVNVKYSFIDRDVRDCQANLSNLIGLVQHSFAFVGIFSGPLMTALSVMPKRCFCLEKNHKITDYLPKDYIEKHNIKHINIADYQEGMTQQWLESLIE